MGTAPRLQSLALRGFALLLWGASHVAVWFLCMELWHWGESPVDGTWGHSLERSIAFAVLALLLGASAWRMEVLAAATHRRGAASG